MHLPTLPDEHGKKTIMDYLEKSGHITAVILAVILATIYFSISQVREIIEAYFTLKTEEQIIIAAGMWAIMIGIVAYVARKKPRETDKILDELVDKVVNAGKNQRQETPTEFSNRIESTIRGYAPVVYAAVTLAVATITAVLRELNNTDRNLLIISGLCWWLTLAALIAAAIEAKKKKAI